MNPLGQGMGSGGRKMWPRAWCEVVLCWHDNLERYVAHTQTLGATPSCTLRLVHRGPNYAPGPHEQGAEGVLEDLRTWCREDGGPLALGAVSRKNCVSILLSKSSTATQGTWEMGIFSAVTRWLALSAVRVLKENIQQLAICAGS